MLSAAKHLSLTTTVMLSAAKHPSLINIAETLRQAQGDNTPYPTWSLDQARSDESKRMHMRQLTDGIKRPRVCHAEPVEASQPY